MINRIFTQPSGTVLTDEEYKQITGLLVKLGYAVSIRKEKDVDRNRTKKIIFFSEEPQ